MEPPCRSQREWPSFRGGGGAAPPAPCRTSARAGGPGRPSRPAGGPGGGPGGSGSVGGGGGRCPLCSLSHSGEGSGPRAAFKACWGEGLRVRPGQLFAGLGPLRHPESRSSPASPGLCPPPPHPILALRRGSPHRARQPGNADGPRKHNDGNAWVEGWSLGWPVNGEERCRLRGPKMGGLEVRLPAAG